MSLLHSSNKLNQLSNRRYNKGRHDIPKILENYLLFVRNITSPILRGAVKLSMYVVKRAFIFQGNFNLAEFYKNDMPGMQAREQRWSDPRVEFAIRNPRERRKRK